MLSRLERLQVVSVHEDISVPEQLRGVPVIDTCEFHNDHAARDASMLDLVIHRFFPADPEGYLADLLEPRRIFSIAFDLYFAADAQRSRDHSDLNIFRSAILRCQRRLRLPPPPFPRSILSRRLPGGALSLQRP